MLYCTCKNTSVICTYSSPPPLPPIPEHALGTVCLPILQHLHHRVPHLCRHLLCEDGPGCGCEGCSWSGWRGARGLGGGVLVVWVEGCSWAGKGEASPLLLDPLNSILEDGSILIDALCSAWWPLAPQAPSPCMPPAPICMPPPPPHTHTRALSTPPFPHNPTAGPRQQLYPGHGQQVRMGRGGGADGGRGARFRFPHAELF